MNVKKFLIGTKDFLMDATIEAIERHFDEEIVQAKEDQRSRDIYAANELCFRETVGHHDNCLGTSRPSIPLKEYMDQHVVPI